MGTRSEIYDYSYKTGLTSFSKLQTFMSGSIWSSALGFCTLVMKHRISTQNISDPCPHSFPGSLESFDPHELITGYNFLLKERKRTSEYEFLLPTGHKITYTRLPSIARRHNPLLFVVAHSCKRENDLKSPPWIVTQTFVLQIQANTKDSSRWMC